MELTKQRPPDPVLWLANYLMVNNPFKPQVSSASPEALEKIAEIERKMKEFELEREKTIKGVDKEIASMDQIMCDNQSDD